MGYIYIPFDKKEVGKTFLKIKLVKHIQFSSVAQSCPSLCDPKDGSPPGPAVPGAL